MAEVLVSSLVKFGVSEAVAGAIVRIGSSILLSAVSSALAGKPKQQDIQRELGFPSSLPAKRNVYGKGILGIGSPAPAWVVNNGTLYCCHILNSRPSASISKMVFDKRWIDFTGDIEDFSGDGALPANGSAVFGHARVWLGLGDQTGPPDAIMAEVGDATSTDEGLFWPTDKWTNSTVLWGAYKKNTGGEVWPSAPPEVGAIGDWSLVWDPREESQDPDDPSTWTLRDNAWLCILDALRQNPLARWPLSQINIDSFKDAADNADVPRTRLDESTEPQWRIGGTVAFTAGSVLLDVIEPMLVATGGDLMIDGEGITAIPAKSRTPIMTVSNWLSGHPMEFRARQKGRDVPTAVQASWPQPEAKFEMQTLAPANVPGKTWSGGEDRLEPLALGLVPFDAQAMHLQNMAARRRALGRRLSFMAGPELFANGVQAGDWVTVDFGSDYATRNGTYEIVEMSPGQWLESEDGVAFRQPVSLRETAATVSAWDEDTDEQDVWVPEEVSEIDLDLPVPTGLDLTTGTVDAVQYVDLDVTPASGPVVSSYEWQWQIDGADDWTSGGDIRNLWISEGAQNLTARLSPVSGEQDYNIRVRSRAGSRLSPWLEETITVPGQSYVIDAGEY